MISFPTIPTPGDTHTENGKTWEWDGTDWILSGPSIAQTLTDIQSALTTKVTGDGATTIKVLTKAAYDALAVKDSATVYIISDAPNDLVTISALLYAATGKATPVDADVFYTGDSVDSYNVKALTWLNLWNGILTKLNTAGLTISNSKTFSGQIELTGQAATNATSAVNRGLLALEMFEQGAVNLNWNTTTGTANSSGSQSGDSLQLSLNGPTAVVGNYREAIYIMGAPMNRNGSGAACPFLSSRFSIIFEGLTNGFSGNSNEIRFLAGVGSVQDLSGAGMGLVITSATTCFLQIHNGTTLEQSASITIPNFTNPSRLLLVWNGSKLILASASSNIGLIPRLTKLLEFSHSGVIPANCSGGNWKFVNIATGTTAFAHGLYLRSAKYVPYALTI